MAPPPIRGWIGMSFHVAAPLRNRAFEVALRALHRGLTAAGERGPVTGTSTSTPSASHIPVLLGRHFVKHAA